MRSLFTFSLALVLAWPAAADTKPERAMEDDLQHIALDGTGRVWGASYGHNGSPLVHLDGEEWVGHAHEAWNGMIPVKLAPGPEGCVVCLWEADNYTRYTVSFHHGDDAPGYVTFRNAHLWEPQMLVRKDGSLLFTGHDSTIVEISPKGVVKLTTISDDFFQPGLGMKDSDNRIYASVCALEDGEQRVWLWSYNLRGDDRDWRLLNFVEYADGRLTRRDVPGLAPEASVSAMKNMDAAHLWYAKVGTGIYELDLKTMRSALITQPLPVRNGTDNVEYIEQIYRVGEERFALTCPRPTLLKNESGDKWYHNDERSAVRFYNETGRSGRLLRFRAGQWEEIIAGVDLRPRFGWLDRPLLLTRAGLLLASYESGPWLALRPGEKPAVLHGWETDYPLHDGIEILPVDASHMRVLSSWKNVRVLPIEPAREPAEPRLQVSVLLGPIQMDANGNGWGFRGETAVSKWDGERWTDFAVPKEVAASFDRAIWWLDDQDQGWYLSKDGSAAILDLTAGTWKTFESWEAAAEAQLPRTAFEPAWGQRLGRPVYSATGQIAFIKKGERLHYFDGKVWRQWTLPEISKGRGDTQSHPSFRRGRQLIANIDNADFQYDDATEQWRPRRDKDNWAPIMRAEKPPAGCPITEYRGALRHALGTTWILPKDENKLYMAVPGRTLPAFPENGPNPFRYGGWLDGLEVDAKGGTLVCMDHFYYEPHLFKYFHLPATMPVPTATAARAEGSEPVRVLLSVEKTEPAAAEVWFSWQLDDGLWSAVQQEKEILLKGLRDGVHRLAVRAYNAELGTHRTPTILEWQQGENPAPFLEREIAAFDSPEREKRVQALQYLREKGAAALPPLRAALPRVSAEAREWVRMAIEQIEANVGR